MSVQEEKKMKEKERERELLLKAKTLFSEKGFYRTSVSDIVESLGIARGTFYLYFRNKDDIYRRVLEKLVNEISSSLKVLPEDSPLEQLRENLKSVFTLMVRDRDLAKLIFYHPYQLNPQFDEVVNSFFNSVKFLIERALIRGIEMGIVRECNVKIIAPAIMGAFVEVGKELVEGKILGDVDRIVEEILQLGLKGLLGEK